MKFIKVYRGASFKEAIRSAMRIDKDRASVGIWSGYFLRVEVLALDVDCEDSDDADEAAGASVKSGAKAEFFGSTISARRSPSANHARCCSVIGSLNK